MIQPPRPNGLTILEKAPGEWIRYPLPKGWMVVAADAWFATLRTAPRASAANAVLIVFFIFFSYFGWREEVLVAA